MGIDPRLLDLCLKASRDEMYMLSPQETTDLGVVNNGRKPPEWSIAASPGGAVLKGQQTTIDGAGTVSFSCDGARTVFGSVYESAGAGAPDAAPPPRHLLTIGRHENIPVDPLSVSHRDGVMRTTFILPPNLVRLAVSARYFGHQVKPSGGGPPSVTTVSTSTAGPRRWSRSSWAIASAPERSDVSRPGAAGSWRRSM